MLGLDLYSKVFTGLVTTYVTDLSKTVILPYYQTKRIKVLSF